MIQREREREICKVSQTKLCYYWSWQKKTPSNNWPNRNSDLHTKMQEEEQMFRRLTGKKGQGHTKKGMNR